MLPPKMGDGVLGSSWGGVNPTGASFVGASVFSSAAALTEKLSGLGLLKDKENEVDGFHGSLFVLPVVEIVGVKRPAWAAMVLMCFVKGIVVGDYRDKLCGEEVWDFRWMVVFGFGYVDKMILLGPISCLILMLPLTQT